MKKFNKKHLFFAFLIIPAMGMVSDNQLLGMEPNNKKELKKQRNAVQKKNLLSLEEYSKSFNPSEEFNSENNNNYLEQLFQYANGLIHQEQFMKLAAQFASTNIEMANIEQILKELCKNNEIITIAISETISNYFFDLKSPEAINIALHYKSLFTFNSDLIRSQEYTDNFLKEIETEKIQNLINKLQRNDNPEIQVLGNLLYITKKQKDLDHILEEQADDLRKFINNPGIFAQFPSDTNDNLVNIRNKKLFKISKNTSAIISEYVQKLQTDKQKSKFSERIDKKDVSYYRQVDEEVNEYIGNQCHFKTIYEKLRSEIHAQITQALRNENSNSTAYLTLFKNLPKALPNVEKIPIPEINIDTTKKNNQSNIPLESNQELSKDEKPNSKEEHNEKEEEEPQKEIVQNDIETILEETDEYILINDPSNKIRIKIFKTDTEHKPTIDTKNPQYTQWVNRWFENSEEAFKQQQQREEEQNSKKYAAPWSKDKTIVVHAFSKLVDTYLANWAIQGTTSSRRTPGKKDILLTLPGCIYYSDRTFETGLFTYIIDSANSQWYHRNFVSRSGKELINEYYQKGLYEVEFPSLS